MATKRKKKRRKEPPAIAAKQSFQAKLERVAKERLPTPNARIIRDLMFTQKIKGNWKDYVVLAGKRLIDWQGSYDLVTEDGKTVGVKNMALVHKSKLANLVGAQLARQFWRPGVGRVNNRRGHHEAKQG